MERGLATTAAFLGSSLLLLVLTARPPSAQPADHGAATYVGSETCGQCHEAEFRAFATNPHGRAEKDAAVVADHTGCESCHGPGSLHAAAAGDKNDPGFATIRNLRKMKPADASGVCTTCHKTGDQLYWDHSTHARRQVSCVQCHSVHASKDVRGKLLQKAEVNELCLTCHQAKRAQLSRSAHMPLLEGGMDCNSCHNPHGSPAPRMIRAASNNQLCESCHADKRGPFLWEHMPVRENCMNCHDAHGSPNEAQLVSRRPFLCQRCHNLTRHPGTLYGGTPPGLTSNRQLNRGCANCHSQIHGSNHPSGQFFLR